MMDQKAKPLMDRQVVGGSAVYIAVVVVVLVVENVIELVVVVVVVVVVQCSVV